MEVHILMSIVLKATFLHLYNVQCFRYVIIYVDLLGLDFSDYDVSIVRGRG